MDPTTRRAGITATAVAVPVVVVVGIVLFLLGRHRVGPDHAAPSSSPTSTVRVLPPVSVAPIPRSSAADALCPDFLVKLPDPLDTLKRRDVQAQDSYIQAYGDPPVVVECGVPKPAGIGPTSAAVTICPPEHAGLCQNQERGGSKAGVQWVYASASATVIDRGVYITAKIPEETGGAGVLNDISLAVLKTMPAKPLFSAK